MQILDDLPGDWHNDALQFLRMTADSLVRLPVTGWSQRARYEPPTEVTTIGTVELEGCNLSIVVIPEEKFPGIFLLGFSLVVANYELLRTTWIEKLH